MGATRNRVLLAALTAALVPLLVLAGWAAWDRADTDARDRAMDAAAFRLRTLIDESLRPDAADADPVATAERMRAWLAPGEDHPFPDVFAVKLSVLRRGDALPADARVVRVLGDLNRDGTRLILRPRNTGPADSPWFLRIGLAAILAVVLAGIAAVYLTMAPKALMPAEDLVRAQKRLLRAERIAAWRDIAQRIAHEVKNPLSPIQISIETLRKTKDKGRPDWNDIFEESTSTILEEVEHLRRIVTEFSNFARLPSPRPMPTDASETVTHVVSLHQGSAIPVTADVLVHDAVRIDRGQLTQVLVNLVKNAQEAAADAHPSGGGQVALSMEKHADGIVIHVDDNGRGVPEAQRVRIFEPYHSTKTAGTGLGLAIAHRIVEDHGGDLDVTSSPLGGARFSVHLTTAGPPRDLTSTMTGEGFSFQGNAGTDADGNA